MTKSSGRWFCLLALLLAMSLVARAEVTAAGVWQSQSGNLFTIPASNTDFDIIIKTADGRKMLGHGRWDADYPGYRFTYWVDGVPGTALCTFLPDYPDTLRVDGPQGTSYWTRIRY